MANANIQDHDISQEEIQIRPEHEGDDDHNSVDSHGSNHELGNESQSEQEKEADPEGTRSKKRKHKSSKNKKTKRRRKYESSSSSSISSSSSSSSSDSETDREEKEKFHVPSKGKSFVYKLPKSLANYANDYCNSYVTEKELQESVLEASPVPANFTSVKKLDEFIREIMKEKRKNSEIAFEGVLEKAQQKAHSIMGPLSRVWVELEKAVNSKKNDVGIDAEGMLKMTHQTVLLLGQTLNTLSFHCRYNVLNVLLESATETKSMLKRNLK